MGPGAAFPSASASRWDCAGIAPACPGPGVHGPVGEGGAAGSPHVLGHAPDGTCDVLVFFFLFTSRLHFFNPET